VAEGRVLAITEVIELVGDFGSTSTSRGCRRGVGGDSVGVEERLVRQWSLVDYRRRNVRYMRCSKYRTKRWVFERGAGR